MQQRYNSFGSYIKALYGEPVFKVNIDAGFTCPNRDGTVSVGGCTYCNNESFKPGPCRPSLSVREQVENGKAYTHKRYGANKFLAYFQAYTNTHAPVEKLRELYAQALESPDVIGLAIGTRPDCVDDEKLDLLADIAKTRFVLVEYGLQSIYDKTLEMINRGHGYDLWRQRVAETRARGIEAGGHLIMGFPTETPQEMLDMAPAMNASGIRFLKIHQLQIIRDTLMARQFEEKPFKVFGYEEYIEFLGDFIERLDPSIVLQRMFATAPDDILIAPNWGRSRHQIHLDIDRAFEARGLQQGSALKTSTPA